MESQPQKKNVSFQQVLTALLDEQSIFPVTYLRHFSDLEGKDFEAFRSIWPHVHASRRLTLLEDLEDLAEGDTLVLFDNVAWLALEDPDPRVRTVAVRLLWEAEDPRLAEIFIRMLNEDPDPRVRSAAATALGQFVYLGELEEIPADVLQWVEDNLLQVMAGKEDAHIRRHALESLGFSSRDEVPPLIRTAYTSGDTDWLASALYAMGRSADEAWAPDIIRMLGYPKGSVQLEAVRAAGELEIAPARRALLDMLEEEAQDSEIRAAVIWALSKIGGEEVRETLEQLLEETEDEEEAEILEDALDNLSFTEDVGIYGMFDMANLGQDQQDEIENYLAGYAGDDDESDTAGDEDSKNSAPGRTADPGKKRHRRH